MAHVPQTKQLAIGLGLASGALGSVALVLFFMPVLGIPLAAAGALLGVAGCLAAVSGPRSLRIPLFSAVGCCIVLTIHMAIYYAPTDYSPYQYIPRAQPGPPKRLAAPTVPAPPPAPPDAAAGAGGAVDTSRSAGDTN